MAINFRKRIKILPGVYLNFSKKGISSTVGPRGANINFGEKGAFLNTGIPGTGLYSRQKIGGGNGSASYTPSSNFVSTSNISNIDMSIQPKIKSSSFWVIIKGILIQLIPFGIILVLIQVYIYLRKTTTNIYITAPNLVSDRRYKSNYRIDGYSIVKTNELRQLSADEIYGIKQRGKCYLISVPIFFIIAYLIYLIEKN